jgi:hypothetical protein
MTSSRSGSRRHTDFGGGVADGQVGCLVSTCERLAVAKQLCLAHYRRTRSAKGLRPDIPLRRPSTNATCCVKACDGPTYALGLCHPHYDRSRRESRRDGQSSAGSRPARTHCMRGHEFTAQTTKRNGRRKDGTPARTCRICTNDRRNRRRAGRPWQQRDRRREG